MKEKSGFGEVSLDVSAGRAPRNSIPDDETPFCIALIGDFSGNTGHASSGRLAKLAGRAPIAVDRDNFDEVLKRIRPSVRLPVSGQSGGEVLTFSELDDFHPDRILQRSAIFKRYMDLRTRLQDSQGAASVLDELGIGPPNSSRSASEKEPVRRGPSVAATAERVASEGLLDATIAQTESRGGEPPARTKDEFQQFVQRVSASHTVAAADPRQAQVLAVIDRALGLQVRSLLHYPALQALEAAWRAVFLMVRRVETDAQLKLFLLDISQEELTADLLGASNLVHSDTYRLLVEKSVGTPGANAWALLVGNFVFAAGRQDIEVLKRVAKIAHAARAPFLAEASPTLLGCDSLVSSSNPKNWKDSFPDEDATSAWKRLRASAEATYIGLALPRFLLRLPYGEKTDPIETFNFEEMPDTPAHDDYLWGNPAFACALLLADSFAEDGWRMRPGSHAELDRLPLHVVESDGETQTKPCAEVLLTEDTAEKILEKGVMPLASLKNQDTIRVVRFQSMADPLRSLAGPWAGERR